MAIVAATMLRPVLLAALTLPIACLSVLIWGADRFAYVDAMELASVWFTFTPAEIKASLQPYGAAIATLMFAVLVLAAWVARSASARPNRRVLGAVLLSGAVLASQGDRDIWSRTWPINLLDTVLAVVQDYDAPGSGNKVRSSPRNSKSGWQARRSNVADVPETYVFVVGESMRADRMHGCGGATEVSKLAPEALLFCDVLSGSDNTVNSVPLLISRYSPGRVQEALRDSTFLKAFEEVGFETFWLGAQERVIAWPDAMNQSYDAYSRLDRDFLVPAMRRAIARPGARKALVLHAYNAHFPYAERYPAATAPFKVDPKDVDASLEARRKAYDNAMDESTRFMNEVIHHLEKLDGEVFLMMTADHGENLADDGRSLLLHALKKPTWWDTKVPGVVWANKAWKLSHPAEWKTLTSNTGSPLMHQDFVPTMLGVARIHFADDRSDFVNFATESPPASRIRWTQSGGGQLVLENQLRAEAGLESAASANANSH
jgi:glucan phosphoethanolaminetransferase (alkaline phosphatase superfamily)